MVRDYTKWDDNPVSLGHFAESSVRAYKIAMTPPYEPVVIVADAVLARRADAGGRPPHGADSETHVVDAAGGRFGRGGRSGEDAGGGGKSSDRRGTLRAHSRWDRFAGGACRDLAGTGAGSPFPHELSVACIP